MLSRVPSDSVDQPDHVFVMQSVESRTQSANMRPTCGIMMGLSSSNSGSRTDDTSPPQQQQHFQSMWTDQAVPQRDFFRQMFQPPIGLPAVASSHDLDATPVGSVRLRQHDAVASVGQQPLVWVTNELYKPSAIHGQDGLSMVPCILTSQVGAHSLETHQSATGAVPPQLYVQTVAMDTTPLLVPSHILGNNNGDFQTHIANTDPSRVANLVQNQASFGIPAQTVCMPMTQGLDGLPRLLFPTTHISGRPSFQTLDHMDLDHAIFLANGNATLLPAQQPQCQSNLTTSASNKDMSLLGM